MPSLRNREKRASLERIEAYGKCEKMISDMEHRARQAELNGWYYQRMEPLPFAENITL